MKSIFTSGRPVYRSIFKQLSLFLLAGLLFASSQTYSQTIDFQQAQNGDPAAFPITFTNGILNATQTTYYEGLGIPQRLIFTGLDPAAAKYTVYFNFLAGIPSKGVHAYDFIMSWEQAVLTARKIGGALSGSETENELANLFSTACQNAPAACAGLSGALPAANIKRPNVPDMPGGGAFYSGVPANITCFEGTFGDRDIEIRGNQAITSAVMTFVGYTGDYANFKLEWVSTSTSVMIRYASRAAVGDGGAGNFACGYGIGKGAGSINGGNYHNIFEKLVKNNNTGNEIQGSRDNQLSAGAIMPVSPPSCPTVASQSVCASATSIPFSFTGVTGTTYKWSLTNGTPSAGAKLSGADANGFVTGTSVSVVPIGANFLPGGTFSLTIVASKTGTADVTCSYPNAGTIINVEATATATPTSIDIRTAAHNTTLTANIGANSTFTDNTLYTYAWSIVGTAAGSLTNSNQRIATYTADIADASQTIHFKVIVTQIASPNCSTEALVDVPVGTVGECTVTEQGPVCQGSITSHTANVIEGGAVYTWTVLPYPGALSTTASLASGQGTGSVTVNASQSYRIEVQQAYPNSAANKTCGQNVVVVPGPTVAALYVAPTTCDATTYSLTVTASGGAATSPTNNYRVTQGSAPNFSYDQTLPGNNGTLTFSGLTQGVGFDVTVTTQTASCTSSANCGSAARTEVSAQSFNITLNALTETKATRVKAAPNPFTDKVRFNLVSAVSGNGSLELYNVLGQRVSTVFTGYVQAGVEFQKEYSVPVAQRNTLIYVFRVGNQRATGKLLKQ